jgi:carbon storage regulator
MEGMMLVLSRRQGEEITIGNDIVLKVVEMREKQVRLAIDAPGNTSVLRGELIRSE